MIGFVASILVNEVAEVRIEVGATTSALPSPTADDNDVDDGTASTTTAEHIRLLQTFSSGGGNARHIRQWYDSCRVE